MSSPPKEVLVHGISFHIQNSSSMSSVVNSNGSFVSISDTLTGNFADPTTDTYTLMPVNWPIRKKIFNIAIPSLLCFVVSFGSSIYAPAIPDVMRAFRVSETLATLPLTTYVLGLAFGPMLSAPISETFGRLGTYRFAVPISALFTVGAGFAPTIQALCILRFFAGFFGGAPLPVASGTAADLFRTQHFAIAGSFILYLPFLGPAIGPVVGGFATQHNGWKWSQFVLAITMIVFWIPVLFLEETYVKIIIARRDNQAVEKRLAKPASKLILGVLFVTLLRPVKMLVTEPIVALLSIYVAFGFAVVFTFFSSVPYVFGLVYDFDIGSSGLVFLSIALGCTIAVPTVVLFDRLTYQRQARRTGKVAPEMRLWPAMFGAIGLPISLFWFGLTTRKDIHWIVAVIAMVPFAWGNLCIYVSTSMYLIDSYAALTAASAIAAIGLLRYILGGTFPLFTIHMYEKLGIGWATSVLGFLSLAMMPIPWVLYYFGPRIRGSSHFDTSKSI